MGRPQNQGGLVSAPPAPTLHPFLATSLLSRVTTFGEGADACRLLLTEDTLSHAHLLSSVLSSCLAQQGPRGPPGSMKSLRTGWQARRRMRGFGPGWAQSAAKGDASLLLAGSGPGESGM